MNHPAELPAFDAAADAASGRLAALIDAAAAAAEARVISWRRQLHQHPELGNREFRTAGLVAEHLRSLGLDEVRTGVAHSSDGASDFLALMHSTRCIATWRAPSAGPKGTYGALTSTANGCSAARCTRARADATRPHSCWPA